MKNPFTIAGYAGPEYFCDRVKETEKLKNALLNGRNVALISPRRLGKTGLIHHVFNTLQKEDKNYRCFYIDIYNTQNQEDFVKKFASTILGNLDTLSEKILNRLTAFFKSCRPVFSIDEISGKPTVSLDFHSTQTETSLREVFGYMASSGYECFIAIDEFQQITEYSEKGTEALLRSLMQESPKVHFIFAGSKQHLMSAIFTSPNRPFYQCTQKMGLGPIDKEKYFSFAEQHFAKAGKQFPREVFDLVYNIAKGYTWYVQDMLNRLYEIDTEIICINDFEKIKTDIIAEGETTYKDYCDLLPKGQLRLMRAIAKEDTVNSPYDNEFMLTHRLTAPSSVKLALTTLLKNNIIYKGEDGYFIYDRYLSLWLKK